MRIIDTYRQIQELIHQGPFRIDYWVKYAETISQDLSNLIITDIQGYDFNSEVLPVIELVYLHPERLEYLHKRFMHLVSHLSIDDLDVDLIFYLGLCNGAGWVTHLSNRTVILFGVEKILELKWDEERLLKGLIYHELGHVYHHTYGTLETDCQSEAEKSLWQLFTEGIAMYYEQMLCGDFSFYHQDRDDWLTWCEANKSEILQEYKRRVLMGESTQDFFGDWCSYQGRSDVGYYLGCKFIHYLIKSMDLKSIVAFGMEQVRSKFENWEM